MWNLFESKISKVTELAYDKNYTQMIIKKSRNNNTYDKFEYKVIQRGPLTPTIPVPS